MDTRGGLCGGENVLSVIVFSTGQGRDFISIYRRRICCFFRWPRVSSANLKTAVEIKKDLYHFSPEIRFEVIKVSLVSRFY